MRLLGVALTLAAGLVFEVQATAIKVWVSLKDKGPTTVVEGSRRFEDLPLHAPYLEQLRASGFTLDTKLKWQNRVSGSLDETQVPTLRALPFVQDVNPFPRKARSMELPRSMFSWKPDALAKRAAEGIAYGAAKALMESLHVSQVHTWMATQGMVPGRGVRVAIIDADFHLGSPIFLPMKSRIKDQYDFVAKKSSLVTNAFKDSHGAQSMSTIGGNFPGTLVGVAPEADFLLYRAEDDAGESYVEEDYVAAAIERAVDSGAQVISISLGYRYEFTDGPDHPYAQFDGRTRPSSIAALNAARRNVVVSVSVGNLPPTSHIPNVGGTLTAPADADSILAVGIVDSNRKHCKYSCTGPSADGRIKPDVVSMGINTGCVVAVAATKSPFASVDEFAGTSFAAPVVSGVAVLLRQLRPSLSAEEIRQALIKTSDRFTKPDSLVGYGLVDATAAAEHIGVPFISRSDDKGRVQYFQADGSGLITFIWTKGSPKPSIQVLDLSGRRIPVTVSVMENRVFVKPEYALKSGVYIARIP